MVDKNNQQSSLIEWLGYKRKPDLTQARWVGVCIGAFLFILALFLLLATGLTLFNFFRTLVQVGPYSADHTGEAIRNIGLVLAAFLGAPFIIWRSIVAAKQAQIADESLLNDKINAATHGLTARRETTKVVTHDGVESILREWEDDLVTRVGAMDRLEGLAAERNEIAPRVAKLLAAYVRGNFPRQNLDITEPPFTRKTPRIDLQKAIDTIGKVYKIAAKIDQSHWRLDLKACDFDGINFSNGYFRAADFCDCRFEAAIFDEGDFEGCWLNRSLLNFGSFWRTNLTGAKLDQVILNRSGGFLGASINLGNLTGVTFIAADISAVSYLGRPAVVSKIFATKDTIISAETRRGMLPTRDHEDAHLNRSLRDESSFTEGDLESIKKLEKTGFQHWSPYDSSDGRTGPFREKFYEELGMKDWPFYG